MELEYEAWEEEKMIKLRQIINEQQFVSSAFLQKMKQFENSVLSGWNSKKKKWYPHGSVGGGAKTIAYGHKILPTENFNAGITESQATSLLKKDINNAISKIKGVLNIKLDALPVPVQQALVNAMFRGELKSTHTTVKLMQQNKWNAAAIEYINHREYKKGGGIRDRMHWNYVRFKSYGDKLASK